MTTGAGCGSDPIVFPPYGARPSTTSSRARLVGPDRHAAGGKCGQYAQGPPWRRSSPPATSTTWKMVTIRPPSGSEPTTLFYDLGTLRSANQLVLNIPRTGFFSTPAFFANWQTNTSNTMRVTMNQTFIVALGSPRSTARTRRSPRRRPGSTPRTRPDPACYACHQTLDPTRSIFASTWSWNYHNQAEASYAGQPGLFAFRGVVKPVTASTTSARRSRRTRSSPRRGCRSSATTRTPSACDPDDPEFQRIVGDFQALGLLVERARSRALRVTAHDVRERDQDGGRRAARSSPYRVGITSAQRSTPAWASPTCAGSTRRRAGHRRRPAIPRDLGRPAVRRVWPRVDRAGPPEPADALLPRGDREHLRGGRRARRRPDGAACRGQVLVERAADGGDRRLRQHRDGPRRRPIRAPRRRTPLLTSHFTQRRSHSGNVADERAQVHLCRRVSGPVGRLDWPVRMQ